MKSELSKRLNPVPDLPRDERRSPLRPPEQTSDNPGADRRASLRYPAVVRHAWLGWREGREFQRAAAFLLDISLGGCLLAATEVPPAHRTILICLDGPLLPVWFEAKALEVRASESGIHAVRLIFPGSCPYELFMAVAYGHASHEASRRQPHLPEFFGKGHS
jgi:hypothetical protein